MPKDRNKTFGDRQAEIARQKKDEARKEAEQKQEQHEGPPTPKQDKSS